jgi:hypothetical protein
MMQALSTQYLKFILSYKINVGAHEVQMKTEIT